MYKNRSAKTDRNRRDGLQIARNPARIQQKGARRWKVMSQSVAKLWYLVVLGSAGLTCQCPQHEKGRGFCKHMIAVDAIIAKMWNKCRHARMTVLRMPDVACCHCRSKRYVRNGNRINRNRNVQRYRSGLQKDVLRTGRIQGKTPCPKCPNTGITGGCARPVIQGRAVSHGRGRDQGASEHNTQMEQRLCGHDERVLQIHTSVDRIQVALR